MVLLLGALEGSDTGVAALAPTRQGMTFGSWDNMGQRLTDSGSIDINDVRVSWADALGFVDKQFTLACTTR